MSIRRLISTVLAVLSVLGAALVVSAAPASAAFTHKYLSQITETPATAPKPGQLKPAGIAFDSAGNLLLAEQERDVIDVFGPTPANAYVEQPEVVGKPTTIGVNAASGDLYVALNGTDRVRVYKPSGSGGYAELVEWTGAQTKNGAFGNGIFVAVDNSCSFRKLTGGACTSADPANEDVYVVDREREVVDVMKATPPGPGEGGEEFVRELSGTSFEFRETPRIAVSDTTGGVYVVDDHKHVVDQFSPSGTFLGELTGAKTPAGSFGSGSRESETPAGVSVDPSGNLYVADTEHRVVDEFTPAGNYAGQITGTSTSAFQFPGGLGVAPNGDVYVSDAVANAVDVFGPNLIVPDVSTTAPSNKTQRSVTLNGTVNPNGHVVTACAFEYSGPGVFDQTAPCSPLPGPGSSPITVSANLSGLAPGGTFRFKLVASSASGPSRSSEQTVKLEPEAPAVNDQPPTAAAITTTSAALSGTINPGGEDTTYHFVYGTTAAYEWETALVDMGSGSLDEEVTPQEIEGLEPGTTYHFALVAHNTLGTVTGPDYTFTTASLPPPSPSPPPPPPRAVFSNPLSIPLAPPMIAIPNIAFPREVKINELSRAQQLARALRTCAKKPKSKREACRRSVRKKYAVGKRK